MRSKRPTGPGRRRIVQEEEDKKEKEEVAHPTEFEQFQEMEIVGRTGQSSRRIRAAAGNNPYAKSGWNTRSSNSSNKPKEDAALRWRYGDTDFSFSTEEQMFRLWWRYRSYVFWRRYRYFSSDGGTELLLTMDLRFRHMYKRLTSDGGTELLLTMEVQIFCFRRRYKYFTYDGGTDLTFSTKVVYGSFAYDGGTYLSIFTEVQIFRLRWTYRPSAYKYR